MTASPPRVLVAVSHEGSPALATAAELARSVNGRLTVLACLKPPSSLAWCDAYSAAAIGDPTRDVEALLGRVLAAVPQDVSVTGSARRMGVPRALAEEAEDDDVLVIDAAERRKLSRSVRCRRMLGKEPMGSLVVVAGEVRAATLDGGDGRGDRTDSNLLRDALADERHEMFLQG